VLANSTNIVATGLEHPPRSEAISRSIMTRFTVRKRANLIESHQAAEGLDIR